MYLMTLSCMLKMDKMINFIISLFYDNKIKNVKVKIPEGIVKKDLAIHKSVWIHVKTVMLSDKGKLQKIHSVTFSVLIRLWVWLCNRCAKSYELKHNINLFFSQVKFRCGLFELGMMTLPSSRIQAASGFLFRHLWDVALVLMAHDGARAITSAFQKPGMRMRGQKGHASFPLKVTAQRLHTSLFLIVHYLEL